MLSTLFLSRLQFAITITFHIIFPALSIGLSTYVLITELMWLKTKREKFYQTCRFWTKILALTFGMGIISGFAMEFQLGTNWGGFARIVGPVLGVLFTAEVLTAFFIEATFLGFALFGWNRINKYFHLFSTFMVWFGVMLSAFWILAANSWMQTPAGVTFNHNHFSVFSWKDVIFNHSTLIRYTHMVLAAWIATATLILGVNCYYLIKKRHLDFAKFSSKFMLIALAILLPIQIFVGDEAGLIDHKYQPIKTAAMEGAWNTQRGAPMLLFADIEQKQAKNRFEIGIPHLASLINTHQWNGVLQGLRSVPAKDRPYVPLVFYSFRVMVAFGLIIFAVALFGTYLLIRGKELKKWFLRIGVLITPVGLIAMIAGWYTAETGRQPFVVYHLLSTTNAVTQVPVSKVVEGFIVILLIYGVIFGYFYNRYFLKTIIKGPGVYNLSSHKPRLPLKTFLRRSFKIKKGHSLWHTRR